MLEPHARRAFGERVRELDSTERFCPPVFLLAQLAAIEPIQRYERADRSGRDVQSIDEGADPAKEDRRGLGPAGDDVDEVPIPFLERQVPVENPQDVDSEEDEVGQW